MYFVQLKDSAGWHNYGGTVVNEDDANHILEGCRQCWPDDEWRVVKDSDSSRTTWVEPEPVEETRKTTAPPRLKSKNVVRFHVMEERVDGADLCCRNGAMSKYAIQSPVDWGFGKNTRDNARKLLSILRAYKDADALKLYVVRTEYTKVR